MPRGSRGCVASNCLPAGKPASLSLDQLDRETTSSARRIKNWVWYVDGHADLSRCVGGGARLEQQNPQSHPRRSSCRIGRSTMEGHMPDERSTDGTVSSS